MRRTFFIVGPTATGKSELAADVAHEIGAEIVSADAFQIYRGLRSAYGKTGPLDTGKGAASPDRHRAAYRRNERGKISGAWLCAPIEEINSRGKLAIVVGGSGLYIKTMTHGLAPLPESDPKLREKLNAMSLDDLRSQLVEVDPETARKIDLKNRRRVDARSGDLFTHWETGLLHTACVESLTPSHSEVGHRRFRLPRPARALRTNQSASGNNVWARRDRGGAHLR